MRKNLLTTYYSLMKSICRWPKTNYFTKMLAYKVMASLGYIFILRYFYTLFLVFPILLHFLLPL